MDNRLGLIDGRQVTHLTQENLPEVSKALSLALRGQAQVRTYRWHSITLVHLKGTEANTYIRYDDWVKILPHLSTGLFNNRSSYPFGWRTVADASAIDPRYDLTYQRVYSVLKSIFVDTIPNPVI